MKTRWVHTCTLSKSLVNKEIQFLLSKYKKVRHVFTNNLRMFLKYYRNKYYNFRVDYISR